MLQNIRISLILLALTLIGPIPVQQPVHAGDRNCCCQTCRQPCGRCCCRSTAQTATQPVIETQFAQQPVLQQRDVVATEYRNELVQETVPATVVENVIVDEGSYQTVWVPRLTTKAVARTTYQTRTACRTVPYQVTHRISEWGTQTIPYQTVRNVPLNGTVIGSTIGPRYATTLPSVYGNGLIASGNYPTPISSSAAASSPIASVPDARYADSPVTPIRPRSASGSSRFDSRTGDGRTGDNRSADRGPSMFVPAPSAAQVWRSTQGSMIR